MLKLLRIIVLLPIAVLEYWLRMLFAFIDWDASVVIEGSLFDKVFSKKDKK